MTKYEDIDAVNWSTLKHMDTSPLHYRDAVDRPPEDTTEFAMGRATHAAILQPERLPLDYVVFDGERRGNAWKDFKKEHEGATILRRDEMDSVMRIAECVLSHPVAKEWLNLDMALIERAITWIDPATGIKCKGRPDAVHAAIVDLKGASSIDERIFRAQAARLGYFGQLAFYRRGYRTLTKLPAMQCALIAVETSAPHDVGVFVVDEDSMRVADDKITRLLAKVAECRKTGKWPGRYPMAHTIEMPAWAREDEVADFFDVEAA